MNTAVNFKETDSREEDIADRLIEAFEKESEPDIIKNSIISVTSVKVTLNGFVQAHLQDVKAYDKPSPNFQRDQVTPKMYWLKTDAMMLFESYYQATSAPANFRVRDVFDEQISLRHIENCVKNLNPPDGVDMYDLQVWVYYNGRLWFHGWSTIGLSQTPTEIDIKPVVLGIMQSMNIDEDAVTDDQKKVQMSS